MGEDQQKLHDRTTTFKRVFQQIWGFIKYSASSGIGTLMDMGLYTILMTQTDISRTVALTIGRVSGGIAIYCINKFVVFRYTKRDSRTMVRELLKYWLLWGVLYVLALALVHLYTDILKISALISKPVADVTLYALSYLVQRFLIFRKPPVDKTQPTKEEILK